uniref:aralkylamine N-acetyltransferase n=1 Tax=Panagrellus redivivus TaxID=6233 RepID=A0A7E4ZYG6_PANRE
MDSATTNLRQFYSLALQKAKALKETMTSATHGPFLAAAELAGNLFEMSSRHGFAAPEGTRMATPGSATDLKYVIADKEAHFEQVHRLMVDVFSHAEPITRAVGATPADTVKFYTDICEGGFSGPYSILAMDGDKIAGMALNYVVKLEQPRKSSDPMTPLKLKPDYALDISNGPYDNHPANQLVVFIEEVEHDYKRFLPRCNKAFKIDILFVLPEYAGHGIGTHLVEKALQLAVENSCQYALTVATAKASAHIFAKSGFTCAREVPFASFREHGSPVYQNLHDGNTSGKLMVKKLSASTSSMGSIEGGSLNGAV